MAMFDSYPQRSKCGKTDQNGCGGNAATAFGESNINQIMHM
jgi:hypothetical protein